MTRSKSKAHVAATNCSNLSRQCTRNVLWFGDLFFLLLVFISVTVCKKEIRIIRKARIQGDRNEYGDKIHTFVT